ncbi:hypothetical protein BDP27DRAFT_1363330 [Rhodocollybia butyracea]|uniref:F-box domain-containing protein n=1 Tax=Rhodocollybia butyracea TaxID=206335 RepID=A0A9P5U834_9AGAR|nr:hypothetical protein BDP27DRAFT_1363330 [Rhodocollybia butyracea]
MTATVPLSTNTTDLIPLEIYEHIISFLDDRSSLKSCSLTCKSWHLTSWKLLFGECAILIHRNNIDKFLEIVERDAHSVTIIRFIRKLRIEQGGSPRVPLGEQTSDSGTFRYDEYLPRLVGFLSVRNLRLGWIRGDTTSITADSLRTNFGAVTTLELNSVIFSSHVHFFDMLHALPQLAVLGLSGFHFNSGRSGDDARNAVALDETPKPPQLQELYCNVSGEDIEDFLFTWIAYHGPIPVRVLAVGLLSQQCNSSISRFLTSSGPTIETVKIWEAAVSEDFDLSPCTSLRTLRMGWVHFEPAFPEGSVTFVTDIVRTVTSPFINEITVILVPLEEIHLRALDWEALLYVLQRPLFKNLQRFCFAVEHDEVKITRELETIITSAAASETLPFEPKDVFQVVGWSVSVNRGQW